MPLLDRCLQILVHVRRKDACISHFFYENVSIESFSSLSECVISSYVIYLFFSVFEWISCLLDVFLLFVSGIFLFWLRLWILSCHVNIKYTTSVCVQCECDVLIAIKSFVTETIINKRTCWEGSLCTWSMIQPHGFLICGWAN